MKVIENGWNNYRVLVIPNDAPKVQIDECRQAFYAGAAVLQESILKLLSPEAEPTDSDLALMMGITEELQAFGVKFDKDFLDIADH